MIIDGLTNGHRWTDKWTFPDRYYLTYRRKWLRTVARDAALTEATREWESGFMKFFSLQVLLLLLYYSRALS